MGQGLYSFETNQVVHCMYEQPSVVLDHQSNTNIFQSPNFYSNQQNSPGHSQLSQVFIFPVIRWFYFFVEYACLCNLSRNFYSGAYDPEYIP